MNKSPEVFILCLLLVQSWLVLSVAWEVPPPLLFVLLIASMVTLCNFRWCENSRMQWVVGVSSWSGRVNGDEKLVVASQQGHGNINVVAQCCLSLTLGGTGCVPSPGTRSTEALLVWGLWSGWLSIWHLCFPVFGGKHCLSSGCQVYTFCLLSSLLLGPM